MTMSSKPNGKPALKPLTNAEKADAEIRLKPIPLAFAIVPVEGQPGMYRDVVLKGVHAEQIEFLDPDARPSRPVYAIDRIKNLISKMNYKRGLG